MSRPWDMSPAPQRPSRPAPRRPDSAPPRRHPLPREPSSASEWLPPPPHARPSSTGRIRAAYGDPGGAVMVHPMYAQANGHADPYHHHQYRPSSNSSSDVFRRRASPVQRRPPDHYPQLPPPPRSDVGSVISQSAVSYIEEPPPTSGPMTRRERAKQICHLYPILRFLLVYMGIFCSVNNFVFGVINYITDESWEVSSYASTTRYLFPWWMMFLSIGTGYAEFWRLPFSKMLPCDATCGDKFSPPPLIWQRGTRGLVYLFVGALMTDYGYLSVLSGFLSAALGAFNIAFAVWGWWHEWDCNSCLMGKEEEEGDVEAQPQPVNPQPYYREEEIYEEELDSISVVRSWKTHPPQITSGPAPAPVSNVYTHPASASTSSYTRGGSREYAAEESPHSARRPPLTILTSTPSGYSYDESSSSSSILTTEKPRPSAAPEKRPPERVPPPAPVPAEPVKERTSAAAPPAAAAASNSTKSSTIPVKFKGRSSDKASSVASYNPPAPTRPNPTNATSNAHISANAAAPPPQAPPAPSTVPSKRPPLKLQTTSNVRDVPRRMDNGGTPVSDPKQRVTPDSINVQEVKESRTLLNAQRSSEDEEYFSAGSPAEALGLHGTLGPAIAQPRPAGPTQPTRYVVPVTAPQRDPSPVDIGNSPTVDKSAAAQVKHKFLKVWGHAKGRQSLKDYAPSPALTPPLALPEIEPPSLTPALARLAAASSQPQLPPTDTPSVTQMTPIPPELPPPSTNHYALVDANPKEIKDKRSLIQTSTINYADEIISASSPAEALGLHGQLGPAIAEVPMPHVSYETVAPHDQASDPEIDDDDLQLVNLDQEMHPSGLPPPPPSTLKRHPSGSKSGDGKRKLFKGWGSSKRQQTLPDD